MSLTVSRDRYRSAPTFSEYLEGVEKLRELWHAVYERAEAPDDLVEEARSVPGPVRLLALSEDWCGDAVNTLPVIARLAERLPGWELRVLDRDDNPDLMDAHLTDGSRSIPVVMALVPDGEEAGGSGSGGTDGEGGAARLREIGWWGPRPAELQRWMLGEGRELDGKERYKRARRWYARDGGRTTLDELLDAMGAGV